MTYSVNAPVPGRVSRIVSGLRPELAAFESIRQRHSLLVKRLGDDGLDRTVARVRRVLAGTPPIRARITGIDAFEEQPRGPGPVVYLAVESPGIHEVHEALVEEFGAIQGLEGEGYVPHVTMARDGSVEDARRLSELSVDPVEWTITELEIYDPSRDLVPRRISLPA